MYNVMVVGHNEATHRKSVKLYEIKYTNIHLVPDTYFQGVVVGLRMHYET